MKILTPKILFVFCALALCACSDDDKKAKSKGQFTIEDEETEIASGLFIYDTTPNSDAEENDYYRNQIIFYGKGLTIEAQGGEYEVVGEGNSLELLVNNAGQQLQPGTYTWESEENEQPFDLWDALLTLNVNTANELEYRFIAGTITVTQSGSTYKIVFSGTAYLQGDGTRQQAGLPTVAVTAEFEGKLTRFGFDF